MSAMLCSNPTAPAWVTTPTPWTRSPRMSRIKQSVPALAERHAGSDPTRELRVANGAWAHERLCRRRTHGSKSQPRAMGLAWGLGRLHRVRWMPTRLPRHLLRVVVSPPPTNASTSPRMSTTSPPHILARHLPGHRLQKRSHHQTKAGHRKPRRRFFGPRRKSMGNLESRPRCQSSRRLLR